MIVDGSYNAWVRPTRRVQFALSLGMTLTGVILIAAGASSGGRGAGRPTPSLPAVPSLPSMPSMGQAADSVVSGDNGTPAVLIPAAPFVHFAPPPSAPPKSKVKAKPTPTPKPTPKNSVKEHPKPHTKPGPHPRHPEPPHSSDLSHPHTRPAAPVPHRSSAPATSPAPQAPSPAASKAPLKAHRHKR